ncbi:MAG: UPF0149 family protein [Rhodospirillales bacterium]
MSGELSRKLRQLDAFLMDDALSDDAMLLSELDGFLAGVIVCPDPIVPSEWVPLIWRNGDGPVYEDLEQMQTVNGLIMNHYNDIIRQLGRGRYAPIFDVDTRDEDILWEFWLEGFYAALTLRPDAWLSLGDGSDAHKALSVFMRLHEIATLPPDELEIMDIDEDLETLAPDMIPVLVQDLHNARLDLESPSATPAPANESRRKVGRNDPCPCGSGKKFKKCCLN